MTANTSPTMTRAVQALQTSGRVSLTGAPAPGSGLMRGVLSVMTGVVCLTALGGVGAAVFAAAMGARMLVPMFAGLGVVLVMLAVLFLLLRGARRRQAEYAEFERLPVEIDARGLTLRGVGPVPWHHFSPPQVESLVPRGAAAVRTRAVLRLTEPGLAAVNQQLAPELRDRLARAQGFGDGRAHRWIELPICAGLSEPEMIQLLTAAQQAFVGRSAQADGPRSVEIHPGSPGAPIPAPAEPSKPRLRPGIIGLVAGAGVAVVLPVVVLLVLLVGGGQ